MSRHYPPGRHPVDDLIRNHLRRSGAEYAEFTDPLTNVTTNLLRDLLRLVDAALEDEDIDPAVSRRVLERVIYGAVPLPSHVQERKDLEKRMIDLAVMMPPKLNRVDPSDLPPSPGGTT